MGHRIVCIHVSHRYHSAVLLRQGVLMLVLEILHHTLDDSSISIKHQPEDSFQVVRVLQAKKNTNTFSDQCSYFS